MSLQGKVSEVEVWQNGSSKRARNRESQETRPNTRSVFGFLVINFLHMELCALGGACCQMGFYSFAFAYQLLTPTFYQIIPASDPKQCGQHSTQKHFFPRKAEGVTRKSSEDR